MAELDDETRERTKEAMKEFIEIISINRDEIPTKKVDKLIRNGESEREYEEQNLPQPSQVVSNYKKVGSFEELAEWILTEKDVLSEEKIIRRDENGIEILKEEVEDVNERMISGVVRNFRWMAGSIMDYNQGFEYSDEAFEEVFESWSNDISGDKNTYVTVTPLLNFESEITNIPLDENLIITLNPEKSDDLYDTEILQLEISKISDSEREGIFNCSRTAETPESKQIGGSHKIKATINSPTYQYPERIIFEKVILALRLFKPKRKIGQQEIYREVSMWRSGRQDIKEYESRDFIFGTSSSSTNIETSRHLEEPYMISRSEDKKLREFWQQYRSYLPTQYIVDVDSDILRPIQRFNQMYNKSKNEDAIIDCIIGFETTLIKDGGKIPERGTVLLDSDNYDSPYIYKFLDELWDIRNSIVHGGEEMTETEIDGEMHTPDEIVRESRYLLAKSIINYLDLKEKHGKNITEINRDVLRTSIAERLMQENTDTE